MTTSSFHGWELVALSLSALVSSWVTRVISLVAQAIKHVAFHERVYSDDLCRRGLLAVVDRVRTLHLFSQRREIIGSTMQPAGVVIGASFIAHVQNVVPKGYGLGPRMQVRVVRWRWMPPLVPDDACAQDAPPSSKGVITVLRKGNDNLSGWRVRLENACPAAVPRNAAAVARATASQIVEARTAGGEAAQVRVLISGPPGCGKSTTAREVALMLGAVLVPGFDPSRPGHAIDGALEVAHGLRHTSTAPVVISMDEVDVCLRRAVAGMPCSSKLGGGGECPPDVTDKSSWNAMLDMLQFLPNVVLVMSTNLTFAELDALDATGAMLREGRVTHRITVPASHMCDNNKRNKMKRKGPPSCRS